MDVRITLKLAEAELLENSNQWRAIGCELGVGDLHIVSANHGKYSDRCLSEVLSNWIKKERNPSWNTLCNSLENAGLRSKAKQIREKYCEPSTPDPRDLPEDYIFILLRDEKAETVPWSINKKSEIEISKGELLVQKGKVFYVNGNESVAIECHTVWENVAPISSVQYKLLKAIPTAKARFSVFVTDCWMDWGADVKNGDEVYIRVTKTKDGEECCSTAVVRCVGATTEDQSETLFGVEITDSRYYGCGTSDGTFNKVRYFSCPGNNGRFLSLASVAKKPDWLKLEYRPKGGIPVTEGMKMDHNITPTPARRSGKEPSQASVSTNMEVNTRAIVMTNRYPDGTRVIIRTKDGRKVNGTIKWAGELPLEGEDPKKKIPVYGVETDVCISYDQIEPVIALKGRPQFRSVPGRGRVCIPQKMVELDEQINGSDTTGKSASGTKNFHKVAGVDDEERRQGALKLEKENAALSKELGPKLAKETNIEEQMKLLEELQKAKQREYNATPNKDVQARKEAGVNIEESRPADLTLEKEKDALVQGIWPEIAREGDIEEQRKAFEAFQKAKQREDNSAPNKDVYAGGSSVDRQYPAFQQYYPHSNSQLVMRERDQAIIERDQAIMKRDLAMRERDQAQEKQRELMRERDEAIKERDRVFQQATKECDRILKEWDKTKKELEILKEKQHSKCNTSWIVPRRHVTLLEKSLGDGAWGNVREGKFRGQQVAVKCVHEVILNIQTMQRVYREICTMSQVYHPNLVLFIAAVLDDQGGPMIITELLDTTLRKAYEDNLLSPDLYLCMDIFRDVASALCYLHELEEPIIHRDVSSANVLLKAMTKGEWKAKLSDFGSANWAKEASTMGEGAIVYTAPEAYPVHPSLNVKLPPQTTKIDVYSYGILLCEVILRELPNPATLHKTIAKVKVKHASLHSLVLKCTENEPEQRPTMSIILEELNNVYLYD